MEVPRSYLEQSVEESRASSSFLSRLVGGRVGSGAHHQAVAAYRDPLFLAPAHSGTCVAWQRIAQPAVEGSRRWASAEGWMPSITGRAALRNLDDVAIFIDEQVIPLEYIEMLTKFGGFFAWIRWKRTELKKPVGFYGSQLQFFFIKNRKYYKN
jgi:hypothetical protein